MGRRWMLYLFGVAMGSALAYAYFGDRLVDVLASVSPSAAVKQELSRKPLSAGGQLPCLCAYLTIELQEAKALAMEGNVVFSQSETQSTPRYYYIQMQQNTLTCSADFEVWDDSVVLKRFYPAKDTSYECR